MPLLGSQSPREGDERRQSAAFQVSPRMSKPASTGARSLSFCERDQSPHEALNQGSAAMSAEKAVLEEQLRDATRLPDLDLTSPRGCQSVTN